MIKLVNFVTKIMNKAFRWNITFKSKIWLLIMLLVYSHACFSFAFSYSTVCFMHAYHFFGTNGVWLRLENVFGLSCLEYGLKRKKIYTWKAHNSQSYQRSVWKWTPRQSLKKATLWICILKSSKGTVIIYRRGGNRILCHNMIPRLCSIANDPFLSPAVNLIWSSLLPNILC